MLLGGQSDSSAMAVMIVEIMLENSLGEAQ
jgi:hypothetical protein